MITTTRDPRRMIRDAAEFDRRQSGVQAYSKRQMDEAVEMRRRLSRFKRDERPLSAFETQYPSGGGGGSSPSLASLDTSGVGRYPYLATYQTGGIPQWRPLDRIVAGARWVGTTTAITNIGGTGSATSLNVGGSVAALADATWGHGATVTAAAGVGNYFVSRETFSPIVLAARWYVWCAIITGSDLTGQRLYAIAANGAGVPVLSDTMSNNSWAVRRSTTAGETDWTLVTNNAGAQSSSTIAGGAVVASTKYYIEVWSDGTNINARVNDGTTLTKGTDIPTAAADGGQGIASWIDNRTAGSARSYALFSFGIVL